MPITTENSGALVGKSSPDGGKKRVKFLKQTSVQSLGRNSAIGEVAWVSDADARFLCAYKYAVKHVEEVVETAEVPEVAETVEPETEPEVAEVAEVAEVDEADEPKRRFSRRRG